MWSIIIIILISVKLPGLLCLPRPVKGPGEAEDKMSSFLGRRNRGERVKLPRTPIYAKGWIPTGFQASAKIWITNLQKLLLSNFFSPLMEPVNFQLATLCSLMEWGRSSLRRRHFYSPCGPPFKKASTGRWRGCLKLPRIILTIPQSACPASATWVS